MSEMIERVGKAIGAALARGPKRECLLICNDEQQEFLARAAIEAMISPAELVANDDQCLANLVRARFNVGT